MAKKTNFEPDFGPNFVPQNLFCGPQKSFLVPLLDVNHCCKLSLYSISRKNNESIEKRAENLVLSLISAHLTQTWSPEIFFVGFTSTRCYALLQAIIVCNFKEK